MVFSILQRVRGTATIALAFVSSNDSIRRTESTESNGTQANDASGFEIIHHRDVLQTTNDSPLPPGWEGKIRLKHLVFFCLLFEFK